MKEILDKIFQRTMLARMLFFIFADIALISFSIFFAFFLRFENIPLQYTSTILTMTALALTYLLPIFYFLKLYSFSWSYVSTEELISLIKAISLGFAFLGVTLYISKDFPSFIGFPRSTFLMSYFLAFLFCGGIRVSKRIYLKALRKDKNSKNGLRVLIVGAGDAGEQLLRSILNDQNSKFAPIGFVDDNASKKGENIHGLKVLGYIVDIPNIAQTYKAEGIIIALPAAGSSAIQKAVEMSRKAGIENIKIIPSVTEIIDGKVSVGSVRDIGVEDLLGRKPISLDTKAIENFIENKTVLITGAAGSIGSELFRQVAKFNPAALVVLDHDETRIFDVSNELKETFPKIKVFEIVANIQDYDKMEKVFNECRPTVVFHAAAYKHVPLMELHPEEAIKNNIFGTKTIGELAIKYRVEKFIFISTDKAVNPTSVMGATKRVGEKICQVLNQKNHTKFISVRFGNVLNSRGSVIPIFRKQIEKGGPVTITHPEMRRYFMITSEACLLVMQASALGNGGEVFVLDMGEPVKILDLAKEMIRLSGRGVPIIFTNPRPGEKLFEEILTAEEGTVATQSQKIFIANLTQVNEENLYMGLEKLKEAARLSDKDQIKEILKELVASYHPNDNI